MVAKYRHIKGYLARCTNPNCPRCGEPLEVPDDIARAPACEECGEDMTVTVPKRKVA